MGAVKEKYLNNIPWDWKLKDNITIEEKENEPAN